MSKIYIAASWKQKDRVNSVSAALTKQGHAVFDFTDSASRKNMNQIMNLNFQVQSEQQKTKHAAKYDSQAMKYEHYLRDMNSYQDLMKNNLAIIKKCDVCILVLPAGADAHADWGAAVGANKITCVVGYPDNGDRSPSHLWADRFFQSDDELISSFETFINSVSCDRITD